MSTNQQKKKQKERDIRELPIAFKSCLEGGWEHHEVSSTEQKSSVIYEDEFEQIFLTSSYVDTQKEMARKITARLSALGEPVTKESIFCYLLKPVIPKLVEHTTEKLVENGHSAISEEDKLWKFISTM